MYCPKCGRENPDEAPVCTACGRLLAGPCATGGDVAVKLSYLAIASSVLALLSFASLAIGIPAMILGIVSLIMIEQSGGRLTGRPFALFGIVGPVLALFFVLLVVLPRRPRSVGYRMVCGSNLAGIGKAMLIYANDYDDKLPRAGGKGSVWYPKINNWQAQDRAAAFDLQSDGNGGQASISASLYLLVKYGQLEPNSLVCSRDRGTKEFKPADYGVRDKELIDFWDFGPEPWKHCSYTYHMPYGPYALAIVSEPGLAVAADRNPWIRTHELKARDFSVFEPDGELKQQKAGNCLVHHEDGQNVLFLDSHVYFEKRAYCAIDDDNIYTFWDGGDIRRGSPPVIGSQPQDKLDSLLVHDPPVAATK